MKSYILLVTLLLGVPLFAQEVHGKHTEISGKIFQVNEEGDTLSIPNAKIYWRKDNHRAIADLDGNFEIHVATLPDTLIISAVGFDKQAYSIEAVPDRAILVNMKEGKMLDGVEVLAFNVGKTIDLMDPVNVERIGEGELRRAACCNLSESFETNASVDVNITDAVTGAKKIQMLGLDGIYTQLQYENIPLVRGLSTSYGLSFTPGTWIESIQITKGTGTVVNGYESMAGLINIELKKPTSKEALYINAYGNKFGRAEINVHGAQRINDRWSTISFLHAANVFVENDVNKDGFRDVNLGPTFAGMHRWNFEGEHMESRFGIKGTYSNKLGGQLGATMAPDDTKYGAEFETKHLEAFGKAGFFFKKPTASLGLIGQLKYHDMTNAIGPHLYEGTQQKFYFNSIFSDVFGTTIHSYKTGFSFIYDDYNQTYNDSTFLKTEIVPGAFFEYTFNHLDKFIAVAGVRGDLHNLYGPLYAPRMHMKWNLNPKSALRISAGKGIRVPNPYADYVGKMASSRTWIVDPNIVPEECFSTGITFAQKFLTNDNVSTFSIDYFYTDFQNQLILDMDVAPNQLYLYNSTARSYSHSFQAELNIKPWKVLELRSAFKYYDVRAEFNGKLQVKPFVPKYRVLLSAGYASRNKKWSMDVTGNWVSKKRLPSTSTNPIEYQRPNESEDYWILHSQLTYNFRKFSVYLGGENLLNVIQNDAIIAADDPFGNFFDATQIWAPINGFNVYGGIHFTINQKEK